MHCNALQLCVKRCNTFALASSASHRSLTLQRTATHFSTQCSLQHTALHFERFLKHIATHFLAGSIDVQCLIHNATHCNALQRTATHCNTLQNTLQHISFTAVSVFHISCSLTHRCLLTHKCDRCLIHQVTWLIIYAAFLKQCMFVHANNGAGLYAHIECINMLVCVCVRAYMRVCVCACTRLCMHTCILCVHTHNGTQLKAQSHNLFVVSCYYPQNRVHIHLNWFRSVVRQLWHVKCLPRRQEIHNSVTSIFARLFNLTLVLTLFLSFVVFVSRACTPLPTFLTLSYWSHIPCWSIQVPPDI